MVVKKVVIKVYVRCEGCVGYKCYVCRVLTNVDFYSKQPIQVRKELEVKLAAERMEELRAKKEYDKRVTAAWEEVPDGYGGVYYYNEVRLREPVIVYPVYTFITICYTLIYTRYI